MQLVKNVPVSAGDARDVNSIPGWEDSLEQEMATTPVFLSGKFHAHRSLVGYSPWSHKELDMTEYAHTHTNICYGLGNVSLLYRFLPVSRVRHYYNQGSYRAIYLISLFKLPSHHYFNWRLSHIFANARQNDLIK